MINLSTMMDLYRYMEWADSAVWKCALGCGEAREDTKVRD
jgi:hypothetical protein